MICSKKGGCHGTTTNTIMNKAFVILIFTLNIYRRILYGVRTTIEQVKKKRQKKSGIIERIREF